MSPLLLLSLLLPAADSLAYTNAEMEERREAYEAIKTEVDEAVATLPPCEAHRAFATAVSRREPPASCPRSRSAFRKIEEMQTKFITYCEDFNRHLDTLLDDPRVCEHDRDRWPTDLGDRYKDLREQINESGEALELSEITDEEWQSLDDDAGKGEFANWKCGFAVSLGLQSRKMQTSWFSRHDGYFSQAAETCNTQEPVRREYEAFQRGGENQLKVMSLR